MFKKQFGSEAQGRSVLQGVKKNAAMDGLCFDMEGQRAGNSEDAHKLLLWAQSLGKDIELFRAMVKAYNCERGWLGNHDVLLKSAEQANLPRQQASSVLQNGEQELAELEKGLAKAEQLGVSGVPFFLVEPSPRGMMPMSGAVPAEDFLKVFRRIIAERSEL